MPSEPPSQMIRVPTPLVGAVRELARLHRVGRTKAVLEGIEKLIAAIDSESDIDIDSAAKVISNLTKRLERMESERSDSRGDIDIASITQPISERLEKVEADINTIALTIQDLSTRVSNLERVGDIGYAVTPLSEPELSGDISHDIGVTHQQQDQVTITADSEPIAEPPAAITADSEPIAPSQPQAPLTQSALAKRLDISDKAIQKQRQKGKESFAQWSRDRDPDGVAWTWEGTGGRGQPLRFAPLD